MGDAILMGARLYSPGLGRFLQVDPVDGGNDSDYDYCAGDPVNCEDLDGKFGCRGPMRKICALGIRYAAKSYVGATRNTQNLGIRGAAFALRAYSNRYRHLARIVGRVPKINPFPSLKRGSNGYRGRSWGYQINYTGAGGSSRVYKYGITSAAEGPYPRANASRRLCVRAGYRNCRIVKIKRFPNRAAARWWEFRSCTSYVNRYGRRPPGMHKGCR